MLKRRMQALAVAVIASTACGWGDLPFTLVFRDAGGLRPGHLLVLQGVPVGQVESVDLSGGEARVEARLYRKYRETVCSESSFMIERPGGILDITGERQIGIARRLASACTPVSAHAIIRGDNSLLGAIAESASQLAAAAWAKLRDLARAAAAGVGESGREASR